MQSRQAKLNPKQHGRTPEGDGLGDSLGLGDTVQWTKGKVGIVVADISNGGYAVTQNGYFIAGYLETHLDPFGLPARNTDV